MHLNLVKTAFEFRQHCLRIAVGNALKLALNCLRIARKIVLEFTVKYCALAFKLH